MPLTNINIMNKFSEKYSSKIPRINIPLPNYKFFHGVYSENKIDPKFLGRDKIVKQLKSWLINTDAETGVYLVTGFRGMGKSSFVGKVLHEITYSDAKKKNIKARYGTLAIVSIFLSLFLIYSSIDIEIVRNFSICLFILSFISSLIVFIPLLKINNEEKNKMRRIPIHLNLGFGNLNEKKYYESYI